MRERILDLSDTEIDSLPKNVRDFRPNCPGCTPAKLAEPSARPCSFYDCSGLPPELEVTCDTCIYDFVADDGQVKCDHGLVGVGEDRAEGLTKGDQRLAPRPIESG